MQLAAATLWALVIVLLICFGVHSCVREAIRPEAAATMEGSPSGSWVSEDDLSHYSYSDEGSTLSTLADLLERFTIDAQPDCTLKLRSA